MSKETLLQVRHSYAGLITTCNMYLESFNDNAYEKIVVYLSGKKDPAISSQVPANKVIFLELPKKKLKGLRITAVKKLLAICRENNVRLVLAHRYKPTFIMAIVALFHRPRLMLSVVHALDQLKTLSRRFSGWLLLKRQFKFIGVSEAVRQDILQSGFGVRPEDALTMPNCIHVERTGKELLSRHAARELLGLDENNFVIGHVGRLSSDKDQKTLLRAFDRARARIPDANLVIIGGGHLEQELRDEVRHLGLESSVLLTGSRLDAYRIMPAFDVFALTSVREGSPRVLLEAMVSRLPIIATAAGGIPEQVGNITKLSPPGDVQAISREFVRYYEMAEPEIGALKNQIYKYLIDHFSFEIFQKRLMDFVRDAEKNNHPK